MTPDQARTNGWALSVLGSGYILILYLLAIYLLLATLGIQQFQTRGGDLTPQEKDREASVRKARSELDIASKELVKAQERLSLATKQLADKDQQYASLLGQAQEAESRKASLEQAGSKGEGWSKQRDIAIEYNAKAVGMHPEQARLKQEVADRKVELAAAQEAYSLKAAAIKQQDQAIISKIERFEEQRAVIAKWAGIFQGMPADWLTLILALSMGMLGSTIYVTRVFFGQTADTVTTTSWYFIRPLLGAVIALAIYLALKAGVLVFGTGNEGSSGELNPFAAAFLCVVAGMFSERAYQWIDAASTRYFPERSVPAPGSQWATGVLSELKSQNRTVDQLAVMLQVSREIAEKWVSGQEATPTDKAALIAQWLQKQPNDIFAGKKP